MVPCSSCPVFAETSALLMGRSPTVKTLVTLMETLLAAPSVNSPSGGPTKILKHACSYAWSWMHVPEKTVPQDTQCFLSMENLLDGARHPLTLGLNAVPQERPGVLMAAGGVAGAGADSSGDADRVKAAL